MIKRGFHVRRFIKTASTLAWSFAFGMLSAHAADSPPKPPALIALDGEVQDVGWRLPEGYYMPAKMPMTLVHPRPENETSAWARHKKAHPGIQYRIPISVQGGAYPFHYEVIQGPPGMSIGGQYGLEDYGILTWTPAEEGGPYRVRVRITDQELNEQTAEWDLSATTEGFVFVDVNAATSGDGSIRSPLKRFSELDGNITGQSTHASKIAYLRAGTHFTANAPQKEFLIRSDDSPMSLLGYPGENVILDLSNTNFRTKSGAMAHDFFVADLTIRNSYVAADGQSNSRMFDMDGNTGHRFTLFNNNFENVYGRGSGDYAHLPSGSNQGIVHIGTKHGGAYDQYWTLWGNTMANVQVRGFGSLYGTQYGVLENNTMRAPVSQSNGTSAAMIDLKVQNDAWSWRRNVAVVSGLINKVFQQRQGAGGATPSPLRVEMAYNLLRVMPSTADAVVYDGSGADSEFENDVWIYRNTIVGRAVGGTSGTDYNVHFEQNVYLTNGTHYESNSGTRTILRGSGDWADLVGTDSDLTQMLDEEYRLKGEYRDRHLGRRGHEISP
jgi:hypothetical protein